jgi:hypothetical protein
MKKINVICEICRINKSLSKNKRDALMPDEGDEEDLEIPKNICEECLEECLFQTSINLGG